MAQFQYVGLLSFMSFESYAGANPWRVLYSRA